MEGLDVLLVDVSDDCIDTHLVNDLLVGIVCPHSHIFLLEFEEVSSFGIILDIWVDKVGLSDTAAVEVVFLGGDVNFVLVNN